MRSSPIRRKGKLFVCWVTFALVMALAPAGTVPALAVIDTSNSCPEDIDSAGFTDLAGLDSTTRHAVDCLAEFGITRGTSATTYSPNDNVTRWQMALFLIRQADAHGIDLPSGSSVGFLDIAGLDAASQRAINQLVRLGIAQGTTSTTFSPDEPVTRWQMALFLTRLLEEAEVDLPSGSDQGFFDVRVLPSATEKAVNQIIQLDISEGTSSTTFSPDNPVTRRQMALFLTRTLEAGDVEPPEGVTTTTRRTTPKVGAPDLVRVSFDDDDDEETRLLFAFDEPVSADIDGNHIWLVGWNGDLLNPNSVDKSDDADTVEAVFYNEDYENAVAGAVTTGAVYDVDNLDNTIGSYPLGGVTLKTIDWPLDYPELTNVGSFDSDDDTVEFEFDQEVDVIGSASDFLLVEQDGTFHEGDVIVDVEDVEDGDEMVTVVTVEFTGILQSEWNDVVRAYVDEGAVEERGGGPDNLPVAVDVSDSGRSDTPYLTAIDLTDADDGIVVFEFNEDLVDINSVATTDFVLVYHDGSTKTAGTADRNDDDPSEVEVDFGAILKSDLVVYATVLDGAVTEFGGTNEDNNIDTYRMEYRFNNGDTAGPDLESSQGSTAGLGDDTFVLEFEFDEDLDEGVAQFTFDPDTDLLAWDEEGELVTLSGGEVTIDGDTMEIEFVEPDPGVEELNDGDVVRFGIFADEIADEFGFTSYPDGGGL